MSSRPGLYQSMVQHRDLRLLVLGTLATQAGQWSLVIGLGWLMLELTDSAFQVGLVGFAGGLPMLLASLPAGLLLDRFDRRALMVGSQLSILVLALMLSLLVLGGAARPWHLLAASFVNGMLMTVNNAARQTMAPAAVPRSALAAAVALTSAAVHGARVLGPMLAGLVVAIAGISGAFVFQAAAVTVGAALSLRFSTAMSGASSRELARPRLAEGFSYLAGDRVARDLVLMMAAPMLLIFPYLHLLPVFARDVFMLDSNGLALMMAVGGVGAVAGGLCTSRVATGRRPGRSMLTVLVLYGALVVVFANAASFAMAVPVMVLASFCASLSMSLDSTLLQMQLPDAMRGRVTGIQQLTYALFPLGALPMGALADVIGAPLTVTIGALLCSLMTLLLAVFSPVLWRLRAPERA